MRCTAKAKPPYNDCKYRDSLTNNCSMNGANGDGCEYQQSWEEADMEKLLKYAGSKFGFRFEKDNYGVYSLEITLENSYPFRISSRKINNLFSELYYRVYEKGVETGEDNIREGLQDLLDYARREHSHD